MKRHELPVVTCDLCQADTSPWTCPCGRVRVLESGVVVISPEVDQ